MEMQLRNLLQEVGSDTSEEGKNRIQSCFDIIERLSNKDLSNSPNTVSSDIYILCCEAALSVKRNDLAAKCLQLFFSRTIQMNQFVCRAYICQAQLIAPTDSSNAVKFEEAAAYLLKATSIAKTNPKYYFLIYNASLCYWSLARPLMRPGYRRFLSRSLSEITRTLDLIDDRDYDWRCQLMILLAESHLDGNRRAEAAAASLSCLQLARLHAPKRLFDLLRFVVKHSLFDHQKFSREMKTSQSLALVYGLCRLKHFHDSPPEKPEKPTAQQKAQLKQVESVTQSDKPGDDGQPAAPPAPPPEPLVVPEVYHPHEEVAKIAVALLEQKPYVPPSFPPPQEPSTKSDVPREASETKRKSGKESLHAKESLKGTLIESNSKEDERVMLLLEFSRICLDYGYLEYVKDAVECSKQLGISNADLSVKVSFIESEFKVRSLGEKQLSYAKSAVETRSEAIRQCVEALQASQRSSAVDPSTIEIGACVLWNLCLPLCQPPFYSIVRRPLVVAIEALTAIGSLELRIMAQIESMVAKCEEDVEQNVTALERLERALLMDEASGGLHATWLQASITRLRLKTELYRQPERIEDQATMILEQCKSVSDSALSYADRRTLLVQVGNILAPEDFVMVVGVETEAMSFKSENSGGAETASPIRVRGSTARSYLGSLMKLRAYGGKQVNAENFAERLRLWVDLCKASRKHEVWDVCRAAARFALIYDDDRISVASPSSKKKVVKAPAAPTTKQAGATAQPTQEEPAQPAAAPEAPSSGDENLDDHPAFPTKEEINAFSNRELLRMIGEVRQILGESLVQLLKCHGYELYEPPTLTDDMAKKHMKFCPDALPLQDSDWIEYSKWMLGISDEAVVCFLRSGEHAKSLNEPTLAVNAAVCFWNYSTHLVANSQHRQIVNKLETALGYLRTLGHERSTGLVVDLCLAIATAYIQTWAPPPKPPILVEPEQEQPSTDQTEQTQKEQQSGRTALGKKGSEAADVKGAPAKLGQAGKAAEGGLSPEAIGDLKKALEVLEFGLSLTDGHLPSDVIPIGSRLPLIRTWLNVKQMLQQTLPKTLLPDRDLADSHPCHSNQRQSRAVCAVEILRIFSLQAQPTSFKDAVTLQKTIQMVDACEWNDAIVRLEIYTQLARFCTMPAIAGSGANPMADHATAVRCAQMALDTPAVKAAPKSPLANAEANLRCQAALVYGDSLIRSEGVLTSVRLQSCKSFCQAANFASIALDSAAAMSAMRQFWNNSIILFRTASGRKSLRSYITDILASIKAACKVSDLAYKRPQEEDAEIEEDESAPAVTTAATQTREGTPEFEGPDDLTIRVSLYALLFQSFLDEGLYEDCLKVLDKALAELPRTKHRLLLFKHRIMTKARLGVSVKMIMMDIHRFKAESEEQVAEMWKKVALSSTNAGDQFLCYQNAIETLQNPIHSWLKAELYIELAQLLHFHDRPTELVLLHVHAAIDLIMRTAIEKPTVANLRASQAKGKKIVRKKKVEEEKLDDVPKKPPEELQLCDIYNVRQLEVLFRAHTVMAVATQRGAVTKKEHMEACITAQATICRLIKVLVESTVQVAKDFAKAKAAEEKERGKSPKERKGKEAEVVAPEKPKRKVPTDFYPTTLEEWSMFELPDELLEVFNLGDKLSPEAVVTSKSIPQAALTFRWLEELEQQLKNLDLQHLCLPVLCLQNILARTVYPDKTLLAFIHLKYEMLNYQLNLLPAAAFHEKLRIFYGDIQIQMSEQAKWRLRITEEAEHALANAAEESQNAEATAAVNERAALARRNLFLQKMDSQPSSLKILVDAAEIFITREEYQMARQFLWEAEMIMKGVKEVSGFGDLMPRCLYLQAVLAYRERRLTDVTKCLPKMESLEVSTDDETICKVLILHSKAIAEDTAIKEGLDKARLFLLGMQQILARQHECRQNQTVWLEALESLIEMRIAEIDFEIAKQTYYRLQQSQTEQICLLSDRLMDCAEKLRKADYRSECITAMQLRLSALIWLGECLASARGGANAAANKALRLQTLCKALKCAEMLVDWGDEWLAEVMNIVPDCGSSFWQPNTTSLVAHRIFARARIIASQAAVSLFEIRVEEIRQIRNEEERKTAVLRVVEAFTEAKRPLTDDEQIWEDLTSCFPNSIFAWLKVAFHYATNTPYTKAEVLALLGKLSLLSAQLTSPDPPIHWDVVQRGVVSDLFASGTKPSTAPEAVANQPTSRNSSRNSGMKSPAAAGITSEPVVPGETISSVAIQNNDAVMQPENNKVTEFEFFDSDGQRRQLSTMDLNNLQAMIKENAQAMERSKRYLAQAGEYLQQAVTLSLKIGNRQTCVAATLQLVEMFGQLEPSTSAYYLMLYQNCSASLYLDDLVWLSQPDTNASLQASLFNQMKNLERYSLETNLMVSPLYRNVVKLLEQKSMAWRRLVLSQNQNEIMKDFPPNFTFLILQHSPDNRYLYAAIPERQSGKPPKDLVGGGKKNQAPGVAAAQAAQVAAALQASSARVARLDLGSISQFETLLSNWRLADQRCGQISLKHRYQADVVMNRSKMSATGSENPPRSIPPSAPAADHTSEALMPSIPEDLSDVMAADADAAERERELQALEDEFREQMKVLDAYLEPLLRQLMPSLRPIYLAPTQRKSSVDPVKAKQPVRLSSATQGAPTAATGKGAKSPVQPVAAPPPVTVAPTVETYPPETLMIVADPALLELPIEGADLIRSAPFAAVGRDFSMELLWHRFKDDVTMEPATGEEEGGKKGAKVPKLPSRVPALRDLAVAKKPGAQPGGAKGTGASVVRQLPPVGVLPVDTHSFRFFVDVGQDFWPEEATAPGAVYQQVADKYGATFMQRWVGVTGIDHTPSSGEWEAYIRDGASGFIYYGTEHISSSLSPEKVGILCAPGLWLLLSFDMAQTPTSYSRQSKLDLEKTSTHLALEKPVSAAGLMALAGIRSVVAARSMRSVNDHAQSSGNILNLLLGAGLTTGQVIRLLNTYTQEGIDLVINPPPPPPPTQSGAAPPAEVPKSKVGDTLSNAQQQTTLMPVSPNSQAGGEGSKPSTAPAPGPFRHQFTMVCYGLPNLVVTQLPPPGQAVHN